MHYKISQLATQINASPLSRLDHPLLKRSNLEVWVKRDDLLHTVISGNKWRKLKFILDHVLSMNVHTVISMGGAYSNHLHALAYAGKLLGLNTVGFIRGERPSQLNPTLIDLQQWGMQLKFLTRSEYRELRCYENYDALPGLASGEYWLPEGGALQQSLQGVAELVYELDVPYDYLCVPCGTGTTLAGIVKAMPKDKHIIGFAALKGAEYITNDVLNLISENEQLPTQSHRQHANWSISHDFHCGGFARTNKELLDFISCFARHSQVPLEPVYTGKMMLGLFTLIRQGYFSAGQRIIAIHTGGLQGNRGS